MFHLDVSKVDMVLHMLQWLYSHCFKCFIYVQTYVVNVLFEWFKSRSCVADHCPPAAASAPSWFTCWSLRPADASTACIHKRRGWAGGTVMQGGRGGTDLPCWARAAVLDSGAGWERDGTRRMQCGHGTRELCPDAGLGPDVSTLALPIN